MKILVNAYSLKQAKANIDLGHSKLADMIQRRKRISQKTGHNLGTKRCGRAYKRLKAGGARGVVTRSALQGAGAAHARAGAGAAAGGGASAVSH